MSMTVEDIRAIKKKQAESALASNEEDRAALVVHALWSIVEVLAEIRDELILQRQVRSRRRR